MVDRRSFPSLRAFTTFQVAARHLSLTRAAEEINISQAAVSQQIRFLVNEIVQPMCSPGYLARHGPLDTAERIAGSARLDLHEVLTFPERIEEMAARTRQECWAMKG